MKITPIEPWLGAEVREIDLRREIASDDAHALRAAFREHFLLWFPEQDIDDGHHVAAMRTFGSIAMEGLPQPRLVSFVSNHRPDGALGPTAASFHIDYGFFPHPYDALSLYGLEIPAMGTQTYFVNAIAAARDLPDELCTRLDGLSARQIVDVASSVGSAGVRVRLGRLDESYPHFVRPVLWPHRDTAEPILGVWEQQTDAILPLAHEVSTALIEELFAHLYRPEHTYVHDWSEGDLVMWDNHAVQHGRPDVGTEHPRTLRRVCVGEAQDLSIFS